MKRYEYKKVYVLWGMERKMNQIGYEGWELVAVDNSAMFVNPQAKK